VKLFCAHRLLRPGANNCRVCPLNYATASDNFVTRKSKNCAAGADRTMLDGVLRPTGVGAGCGTARLIDCADTSSITAGPYCRSADSKLRRLHAPGRLLNADVSYRRHVESTTAAARLAGFSVEAILHPDILLSPLPSPPL